MDFMSAFQGFLQKNREGESIGIVEIDKLQQVIDKLLEQQNIPPSQLAGMQNSFQMQIDSRPETLRERMQMEIQAYDDLKAGKIEMTIS